MHLNDVVVGIDVASDSFVATILAPDGSVNYAPRKFMMSSDDLEAFSSLVSEREKRFNNRPKLFLESTGIYHQPLFAFLYERGFDVFIINPASIKHITFDGLRKVKNDKRDSLKIALACKQLNIPTCYVPDSEVQILRRLGRTYFSLTDNRADLKIKLSNELYSSFPGITSVFSDITTKTAIQFLSTYPTPKHFADAPKDDVLDLLCKFSKKGVRWSNSKYDLIMECATAALASSHYFVAASITAYLSLIEQLTLQIDLLVLEIHNLLESDQSFSQLNANINLLQSIPGVGFISSVALVAEIGDFSRFSNPKQLIAYMGIDPSVNESGNFRGDRNRMSKRGSKRGRRVLYTIAMASIRTSRSGSPINPVLREYYLSKTTSKKKKVALGAIMNKLTRYIYAIFRDQQPYELRNPNTHIIQHHSKIAA